MKKALDRVKDVKWTVLEEFWHTGFGLKVLPPVFVEFAGPRGMIVFSDPDLVQELYYQKNQHMEKSSKFKRVLGSFIGSSILFDRSDEVWT